jgi:hypothetical protein
LEQFAQEGADVYQPRPGAPQSGYFRRYGPGTILDVLSDTDYQFPASGLDAGRYVTVLQAELRAIASRLVMPEFMLTSDASNANYSSTMVAEGPAMRMFDRMQQDMIEDDLAVMAHVVQAAADAGCLPPDTLERVAIQAVAPTLAVRERLQDAQADQILVKNQAMSVETMAARHGLSPDHEQQLIARRADVRESNYDPAEPRDERGRWTTGGSSTTIGQGPTRARAAAQGGHSVGTDDTPELSPERKAQLARAAADLDAMVAAGKISKKERDLRYEGVKAALGHKMGFDNEQEPNPAHFEKRTKIVNGEPEDTFHLRPGQATVGIHDRVYRISDKGSNTGCTRAAQSIMLEAQAQSAKQEGKTTEFDDEVAGKTLPDLYPRRQDSPYQHYEGGYNNGDGLDPKTFVPGDRVWMQNHEFVKALDGPDYEGSNVIYAGKDENGVQRFVHMDCGTIIDEDRLKEQVQGYTKDKKRQDKVENYKFRERYTPVPRSF